MNSRQPRGIPTGGQFAAGTRAEADIDLDLDLYEENVTELVPEEMLRRARMSAAHLLKSGSTDASVSVDDIAQEAMLAALKARDSDPSIIITPRYLHSLARIQVTTMRRGALNYREYKAAGMLAARVREAREAGVELTSEEITRAADEIRMSFPAADRPRKDYVQLMNFRQVPMDAEPDALEVADTGDQDSIAPQSPLAQALLVASEDTSRPTMDGLRKDVWAALGRTADAPVPGKGIMTWKRTAAVKACVEEAGGPVATARAWFAGQRTDATDAIASLFPGADTNQVFATLRAHPEYAERLLASALTSARK